MPISVPSTITAPISLAEYAKTLDESSRERVFVENMARTSDLLAAFPFMPAQNGKKEFMDIGRLPTVGFRNFNAQGNKDTGNFNLREEDTFPIDEFVEVDRAIVDRLGPDHKYKQLELKNIALSQYASQILVKGDNSAAGAKQPNGIQVRCNQAGINLFHNSVASGGAALSLAQLDILYWSVNKPTHWLFPRTLMPYLDAAARNTTLTGQSLAYDSAPDEFGRRILRYKGLPILFGYEPDDTPDLLPMTEVGQGGGAAATGSIYCLSLGDGKFYGIEQTPLNVGEFQRQIGTPFDVADIKWDWGIVREHPRAFSRLTSITAATIVA
ncbi:major capsid protein [Rhizobium leguminosarum]|uniref:major capsid protein n=1 Tax=Rhizobium leguminosarum TaxID=384 RepID=UPI00103E3B52|nr:hypothetical protein [Rhizobium leguminosarum]TBY41593.1 hypothetical protein E0H54_30860 [Rhizobium leguminosarum bv. viciae]